MPPLRAPGWGRYGGESERSRGGERCCGWSGAQGAVLPVLGEGGAAGVLRAIFKGLFRTFPPYPQAHTKWNLREVFSPVTKGVNWGVGRCSSPLFPWLRTTWRGRVRAAVFPPLGRASRPHSRARQRPGHPLCSSLLRGPPPRLRTRRRRAGKEEAKRATSLTFCAGVAPACARSAEPGRGGGRRGTAAAHPGRGGTAACERNRVRPAGSSPRTGDGWGPGHRSAVCLRGAGNGSGRRRRWQSAGRRGRGPWAGAGGWAGGTAHSRFPALGGGRGAARKAATIGGPPPPGAGPHTHGEAGGRGGEMTTASADGGCATSPRLRCGLVCAATSTGTALPPPRSLGPPGRGVTRASFLSLALPPLGPELFLLAWGSHASPSGEGHSGWMVFSVENLAENLAKWGCGGRTERRGEKKARRLLVTEKWYLNLNLC